jgi:hypothetical protein
MRVEAMSEGEGLLRVEGPRLGHVREVVDLLNDLEHAYNNFYVFDSLVSSIEKAESVYIYSRRTPKFSLIAKSKVSSFVLPEDKLRLHRIEFNSPGFWEFMGALNPLEVMRKWVADHHERRKDRDYRESLEAERLYLENEKLKTEVVRDQVALLRENGVPEEKIREALTQYIVEPLTRLERHQDAGMIGGARLSNVTSGEQNVQ